MPRGKRLIPISDAALHIIAKGNNRYYLFAKDEDKVYYYPSLSKYGYI